MVKLKSFTKPQIVPKRAKTIDHNVTGSPVLEVLPLDTEGSLVGLHQLLQLLYVGSLQVSHLERSFGHIKEVHEDSRVLRSFQTHHLDTLLEEDEGGHGGNLVLSSDILTVVHIYLRTQQ